MNLADIIVDSAQRFPDKQALVFGGHRFTYDQLLGRIRRLARGLKALGVGRGDHVAIVADNSDAVLECVFACAWIGAVSEQYNTRLSTYALGELLHRSPAKALFASARFCDSLQGLGLADDEGHPVPLVSIGDNLLGGAKLASFADAAASEDAASPFEGSSQVILAYDAVLGEDDEGVLPLDLPAEAPCAMFFTSGTTGLPRGVVVSHGAFLERLRIDCQEMGFSEADVLLCVLPLFHVTSMAAYVALMVGAKVVIARANDGESISRAINAYGVTRLGLVPFLMRSIVDCVEKQRLLLPTLELIIYGGEPIDERFLLRCRDALHCALVQGYGMTETLSAITLLRPTDHLSDGRLETAGTVVEGMELRILDEAGQPCALGERGEVAVRTPTLMLGYYGDPEHTAEVMEDGWYRTGDIGYLDDEGYLTLVDRKHNMVITGGENVYPSEVARCLRDWGDAIADVAVVGVPDSHWGEALVAFVVLAPGAQVSAEELIGWCRERLGAYKKPRQVVFVESLQRNSAGKVPADFLRTLTESVREESHG